MKIVYMKNVFSLFVSFLLLAGCASSKLTLHDWQALPKESYTIPPFAKVLSEFKIALDPGHGGMAHLSGYKRGPSGTREAEMNLNVALYLKEFLELAGAQVFLTRTDDQFISLQDRADRAERAGCDFMISLHHNSSGNPQTNFAAVFYHLTPGTKPFAMDLARNIYFGLVEALRLPQVIDDGLLPDKLIYPAGFGLLRHSKIPAILLESSFYSNLKEEKRLTDKRYNRREAYGIFLGLARWAAGGIPKVELLEPKSISRTKQPRIRYQISDGINDRIGRNLPEQRIFPESVVAKIDAHPVSFQLTEDNRFVTFYPDTFLTNGIHEITVNVENMFKNNNLPGIDTLIVASPTDSISFFVKSNRLPVDKEAILPIELTLFDKDGQPVWDSTHVHVSCSSGHVLPENPTLRDGKAIIYLGSPADTGLIRLTATADSFSKTLELHAKPPGKIWTVSGVVLDDSTHSPIPDIHILLNDSMLAVSDRNGVFHRLNPPPGPAVLTVQKNGFLPKSVNVTFDSLRSQQINFLLKPVLGGILQDQVVILDAAAENKNILAGMTDSTSVDAANLHLAERLEEALRKAGALPILIRRDETPIPLRKRIEMVNDIPEGWYLKVRYETWPLDSLLVQTTIYPANHTGELIAKSINAAFTDLPAVKTKLLQNTDVPEVRLTNKTAVEILIRCKHPEVERRDLERIFRGIVTFRKHQIKDES